MTKLAITQKEVVDRMARALIDCAQERNIDISEISVENWQGYLDDAFGDGGEVRCCKFGDLSIDYALQYGKFESDRFMKAHYNACVAAVRQVIRTLHPNTAIFAEVANSGK